jgi:hypothetical protein
MTIMPSTAPAPAGFSITISKPGVHPPITARTLPDLIRLPELIREWLRAASLDAPVMRSAPFLELQLRAQKLGLTPMVRYEIDEPATAKFAKAVLDMQLDEAGLARSRTQLLKAALRSTRGSLTLRDTKLIPPRADGSALGPHRMFEAHKADAMRDRNFANFKEAFEWLGRAEVSHATQELAKREKTIACTNPSFLAYVQ